MNHLTSEELQTLRDTLETERTTLEIDLAQHGAKESNGAWDASSSGLTGEESDPTDAADQIEELVTNVPIVDELAGRMHDVVDALDKMQRGVYGLCEVGGEAIDVDRLVANPSARTCIAHSV